MALLQESNVVFYHPLNDLTESTQAQAWVGSSSDAIGKVGLSKSHTGTGSISLGNQKGSWITGSFSFFTAVKLDSSRFVVAWADSSNQRFNALIMSVVGSTITFGATVQHSVTSGQSHATDIAVIDSTKVIFLHRNTSVIGLISGTDITFGADVVATDISLAVGAIDGKDKYAHLTVMSPTAAVAIFVDSSNKPSSMVGTIGPSSVTWQTPVALDAGDSDGVVDVARLDATHFVAMWDRDTANDLRLIVGEVSGTTILYAGNTVDIGNAKLDASTDGKGNRAVSLVGLSSTKVAMVYRIDRGSGNGLLGMRVFMISGSAITVGSTEMLPTPLNPAAPNNRATDTQEMAAEALDQDRVAVFWLEQFTTPGATAANAFVLSVMRIAGTTATQETIEQVDPTGGAGSTADIQVVPMSSTRMVALWDNVGEEAKIVDFTAPQLDLSLPKGIISGFGTESEFLSAGAASNVDIAVLSSSQFVVAYADAADSQHGTAKIATVSGADITFGSESEFAATDTSVRPISIVALGPTNLVVLYEAGGGGQVKVGTVSGTDITWGSATSFNDYVDIDAVAMDGTRFVMSFTRASDSLTTAQAGAVSGTATSLGSEVASFISAATSLSTAIAKLDTNKFVAAWKLSGTDAGTARVGTTVGVAISVSGAAVDFLASTPSGDISLSLTAIDASTFIVAYEDTNVSVTGKARVGIVSGTNITYGSVVEFRSGIVDNISATTMDSMRFAVSYRDGTDANHGTTRIGVVSGATISFGAESEFRAGGEAISISAGALDATSLIVAYADVSDSSHGTTKVGTLAEGDHATAVSATRVAFSSWMKLEGKRLNFGPGTEFEPGEFGITSSDNLNTAPAIAALDSTRFVIGYPQRSGTDKARVLVLTVSGNTVTVGPASDLDDIEIDSGGTVAVATLDSNRFMVAYGKLDGSDTEGVARIGTVSGTDITVGPASTFNALGSGTKPREFHLMALSSDRVIIAYNKANSTANNEQGVAKIGLASGTTITWGTEHSFTTLLGGTSNFGRFDAGILDSSTAVVIFKEGTITPASVIRARVGTISGFDITWGAGTNLPDAVSPSANGGLGFASVTGMDSTRFIITFARQDESPGADVPPDFNHGQAVVGTVSGGTVTFGPISEFQPNQLIGGPAAPLSAKIDSERFLVACPIGETGGTSPDKAVLTVRVGEMEGTSLSFSSPSTAAEEIGAATFTLGSGGGSTALVLHGGGPTVIPVTGIATASVIK